MLPVFTTKKRRFLSLVGALSALEGFFIQFISGQMAVITIADNVRAAVMQMNSDGLCMQITQITVILTVNSLMKGRSVFRIR